MKQMSELKNLKNMEKTVFKKLFESHGFTVEKLTDNSFIADDGLICVPYTEYTNRPGSYTYLCGISFLSEDKTKILKIFNRTDNPDFPAEIGYNVWDAFMNRILDRYGITPWGRICNHDHSVYEIESMLEERKKTIAS